MKNIFFTLSISLLITCLFHSCSEDVVLINDGSANCIRCFSASVNDAQWEATTENGAVNITTDEIANTSSNQIVIMGTSTDGAVFTIEFSGELVSASYTIANASITYTSGGVTYTANSDTAGSSLTLEITAFNLEEFNVSGTFSGTLVAPDNSSIVVTNGVFNEVNYVRTETITHNASGTMIVDIDSVTTNLNTISVTEVSVSSSTNSTFTVKGAESTDANAQYVEFVFPSLSSGTINFQVAAEGTTSATYYDGTTVLAAGANGSITFQNFTTSLLSSTDFNFNVDNSGTSIVLDAGSFTINY